MKKFWKFLGITALAAALIPYRVNKDDETGDLTLDALLWQGKKSIRDGEKHINVNFAPWFSPNRTDDLDSLELNDGTDGLDVLDEDLDDLEEEFADLEEEFADLDGDPADPEKKEAGSEPVVEITLSIEKDETDPAQA